MISVFIILVFFGKVDIVVILKRLGLWFNFKTIVLCRSLFESVCIPQSVQSVFCTAAAGTHTGDHHCLVVFFTDETVSQHHCQLTPSERHMLRIQVDRSDTLFQSQKRLVYFSPFHSPLFVVRLTILSPFRTCQIHHQYLTLTLMIL